MEAREAEKEAASRADYDKLLASKTKEKNIDVMINKYMQTRILKSKKESLYLSNNYL